MEKIVQSIEEPIEVEYRNLTIEEFEESNYPDSKLVSVHVSGKKGREYELAFVHNELDDKFIYIGTPASPRYHNLRTLASYTKEELKRIKKEEELESRRSLESFARRVRERTGGRFDIYLDEVDPDAIRETSGPFGPCFAMTIDLSGGFQLKLERGSAERQGKLQKWEEKNRKYNKDVSPPMEFTHQSITHALEFLYSRLREFEIDSVTYEGLTREELKASSLPPAKMSSLIGKYEKIL